MIIKNILDTIKNNISQSEYQKTLKYLSYNQESSNHDKIVFSAPNPLIAQWIRTKYSEKIAHLYETQTGKKVDVVIDTKNKAQNNKKVENVTQNKTKSTLLNPSFTFDTFIVGDSNQYAFTSALAVADKPGSRYNPLFIYGFSGLGKTHLLQAIGNKALESNYSVIYTTSEQFMNDFIENIRNHSMKHFRTKYRKCDFLLIDDIQFLSGKEQTQEEFFHTFNELHSLKKQIVLTSDKSPKKIAGFEERLKSRFEWGLMADVQPPGLETKISIIQKKCEVDGLELKKEIIDYIASNMGDNIREIEGAIINLNAQAKVLSKEVTLEFAKLVLKEHIQERNKNITLEDIVKIISKELNIKQSDIKSKKRTKAIVEARRIAIYLTRELTQNSMPTIATYFDMKDHTAVSHNVRKINEMFDSNESFRLKVEEIKNKIKSSES